MARPRSGPVDPDRLTLADLRHALDEKERELRELLARRDALAHELEELGETLQAMLAGSGGAAPRTTRAPRAERDEPAAEPRKTKARAARTRAAPVVREGSLQMAIRAVLERVIGPLRVAEIVEAVRQAGYASKSANLNIIVSNRLAQMDDVEKVDRGLYQLIRPSAAPAAPTTETGAGDGAPLVKAASA